MVQGTENNERTHTPSVMFFYHPWDVVSACIAEMISYHTLILACKVGKSKWRGSSFFLKAWPGSCTGHAAHIPWLITKKHCQVWEKVFDGWPYAWLHLWRGGQVLLLKRQKGKMWSNQLVIIECFYKMEIVSYAVWLYELNQRMDMNHLPWYLTQSKHSANVSFLFFMSFSLNHGCLYHLLELSSVAFQD